MKTRLKVIGIVLWFCIALAYPYFWEQTVPNMSIEAPNLLLLLLVFIYRFVYTIGIAGAGPLLLLVLRKRPITRKELIIFSIAYTILVCVCTFIFLGSTSISGNAEITWGFTIYLILAYRLEKKGLLAENQPQNKENTTEEQGTKTPLKVIGIAVGFCLAFASPLILVYMASYMSVIDDFYLIIALTFIVNAIYPISIYAAGPLILLATRKRPITSDNLFLFSVLYTFIIGVSSYVFQFIFFGNGSIIKTAAITWGVIFYFILRIRLTKKGLFEKKQRKNKKNPPPQEDPPKTPPPPQQKKRKWFDTMRKQRVTPHNKEQAQIDKEYAAGTITEEEYYQKIVNLDMEDATKDPPPERTISKQTFLITMFIAVVFCVISTVAGIYLAYNSGYDTGYDKGYDLGDRGGYNRGYAGAIRGHPYNQ